jgi:hypothetical protein
MVLATSSLPSQIAAGETFPFVIPGLAVPPAGSIVDLSGLNEGPAGAHGFMRVKDGHFVDGRGRRVRFLASNFTFGSCFPDHAEADKLAARLASLGINCIRFHHMDNQVAPRGIWKAGTPQKNEFDPGQLDKLDHFIAALKRHGIYSNINLHVSRNYWEGEEFPDGLADDKERLARLPKYGKGIDKINDQMIRMQREYARKLLTHVNPHTKTSYAKEPCVAIVEINNENSLLQLDVAELPDFYQAEVIRKWNQWLKARHGTTERLIQTWGGNEELGANILSKTAAVQGGQYLKTAEEDGEIRVSLTEVPATNWHAQLHWTGLPLEEGRLYTLEFSARSGLPRKLPVSTRLSKPDWHNCGLMETVDLEPQWKTYSHSFHARRVEPGAVRLDMVVGGGPVGDFSLRNLTLRRGGFPGLKPGESLEAANIGAPTRSPDSPKWLEWTRFLAESERNYTDGMRAFLKNELGVEAAIIDTQASYGGIAGTYRESFSDFVDMHAYWQHPRFPGQPWDRSNWNILNTPMVDDPSGGNLARLAIYRVAGKPFTVSEYDHPAPSDYAAEMFPMIASFAALQDWDGLFQFDWGGTQSEARQITSFFALQQHPAKLAFLPAAAMMFRRGDVAAAPGTALLTISPTAAEQLTASEIPMLEAWKEGGLAAKDLFTHRLEVRFSQDGNSKAEITQSKKSPVSWDAKNGLYTVNAPAAKVVVGRCTGKTTQLTDAEFTVRENPRDFAVIALNAADGKPVPNSGRLLLTTAGNIENTGMGWNAERTSVGTKWGTAPTLCEGISTKVSIATLAKAAKIHRLDGSGARVGDIPGELKNGVLTFETGPEFQTLWFEIVLE